MLSTDLHHIDPASILVDREERQRREFTIEDLIPSVQARGIMLPLIVQRHNLKLVAGERRLATAMHLNLLTVPVRFSDELSSEEAKLIELEENVKRKALSWQDEALAVLSIHHIRLSMAAEVKAPWTIEETGEVVGYSRPHTTRLIAAGEALSKNDAAIAGCTKLSEATTILDRRRGRAADEMLNQVMRNDAASKPKEAPSGTANIKARDGTVAEDASREEDVTAEQRELPAAPAFEVRCADAFTFLSSYDSEPFNFLHVDFPYGVELNEQAGQGGFEGGGYASNPKIYWELCEALASAFPRIAYPASHMMFWFAFPFLQETLDFFQSHPNTKHLDWQPTPLVWWKTDNRGILSDPRRRPRNVGEYALLAVSGDRFLVKPKANIYGAPTDKASAIHTNEKPEPMLSHFFELFIDEHSRVFDPTCGSGSSIRTAEKLGAQAALGLEMNPEFASRAQSALEQARGLRALSEKVRG